MLEIDKSKNLKTQDLRLKTNKKSVRNFDFWVHTDKSMLT